MKKRLFYPLLISTFYWLGIEKMIGGIFELGRYVELLQLDLIIAGVWEIVYYQRQRWKRLIKKDKKNLDNT